MYYVFQRYLSNATLTYSKQTYLFTICIGWCLCHLVHSLEHTHRATVTSYYGLLTLCPLWRSTSGANFFKLSHLLGCNFNFQFLQGFTSFGRNFNFQFLSITMEHQNHLRQRSNLDQDQRQNLQQEQDRRRGQVANLSVEMGNDDSHFSPLSNTTKGETFWTHN